MPIVRNTTDTLHSQFVNYISFFCFLVNETGRSLIRLQYELNDHNQKIDTALERSGEMLRLLHQRQKIRDQTRPPPLLPFLPTILGPTTTPIVVPSQQCSLILLICLFVVTYWLFS